jgi:hypothetical protein
VDDDGRQAALLSAMTTEHFVLQTAATSTITESSGRSTLYVMALSSALVATGFVSQVPGMLVPFAATVLPAVVVLGLFTVVRLVDTSIEYMQYLSGIARIRAFYRGLGGEAALHFSARHGRWPEVPSPAMQLGPLLAFLGTTASMIAVINHVVAGAAISLVVQALAGPRGAPAWLGPAVGVLAALGLTMAFLAYQRWRFRLLAHANPVVVGR